MVIVCLAPVNMALGLVGLRAVAIVDIAADQGSRSPPVRHLIACVVQEDSKVVLTQHSDVIGKKKVESSEDPVE